MVFTLTNWSGHPEVAGDANNVISSDWVGVTREILESTYGGTAIHLPECLGGMQSALSGDVPLVEADGTHVYQVCDASAVADAADVECYGLAVGDPRLDGDGDPDFVTGKRFMAHNGGDPDAFDPLGVYWYELRRGPAPTWTKHIVSHDEGIGSGVNICVADLDSDGDLDIVVTGKWGGPAWFENRRTE